MPSSACKNCVAVADRRRVFFFNDPATTEIYTLSLHDALPIFDALASLTAQVTAPSAMRVLTIGVGPTFAVRWFSPRLADFRKHEPDIDVRITTGGAAAPFGDDW